VRARSPSHRPSPREFTAKVPAALLAAALRAQSEGVFIGARPSGPQGLKILFANDSFCAITGRSAAEIVGKPHGVLHADQAHVARLREWLRRAKPGTPLAGEGELVRGDGSRVVVAWSFDPLCDDAGRVTHVVATYRDQTEKRRLEEALVHAQRLDAVGRLAGGVAHDFNNLLSVINGYCEMLAAHVAANPQALREVAEIHSAGRKAAALTQQLLAFSRRQPLNARVINLNTLVTENAAILQRLLGTAGTLELELAEGLPNVRTDPAQFQQVLFNLVLNARDALRSGGRIVVSTALREIKAPLHSAPEVPGGRYVTLSIADNGSGMDAETQRHLFEPFFTTKPQGKGTGLGLALVYGVVQQSGGFITVESELFVGSTFEVLLPEVNEPVTESPPVIAPLPSMRGSEYVLLVEEDDVVRKMVAGILTADGYRVTATKSFAEATRFTRRAQGLQLFVGPLAGDGEKFVRRLVASRPELRVLCTAQNDFKLPVSWLPPERQAIIHKPYALSDLMRAARSLLDA
jgi:two-component system, cell cycle sensor histidine kinase and response regulator CckA